MFSSFSKEYSEIWNNNKKISKQKKTISRENLIYSNELVKDIKILKRCNSLESIDYNINRINNEINIRLGLDNRYSIESALYSMEGIGDIIKKIKDGVLFVIGKIISFFQFLGKKIAEFFGKIFKKKTEQVKQEVEEADKMAQEIPNSPETASSTTSQNNDNTPPPQEVKSEPEPEPVAQPQTEKPKPTFNQQTVKIKKPQYDLDEKFSLPWPNTGSFEKALVSDKLQDRIANFFNLDGNSLTKKIFNSSTTFEKLSKDDLTEDEMKQIYEENKKNFEEVINNRDSNYYHKKNINNVKKFATHGVKDNDSNDYKDLVGNATGMILSSLKRTSYEFLKIKPLDPPSNSQFYILLEKSKEIEKNIENDSNFIKVVSKNLAKTYEVIKKLNTTDTSNEINKLSALPRDANSIKKLIEMRENGEISNDDYKRNSKLIKDLNSAKLFRENFGRMCSDLIHFYQNLQKISNQLVESKKQTFSSFLTVFSIYSKQLKFVHAVNLAKEKGKKVEII